MMQMLAAGGLPILTDGIRVPDENNPHGYFEFEPVKRPGGAAEWIGYARGKAVKVIYALLAELPASSNYRVIMMRRSLPEVISSQRAMLVRSGRRGADVSPAELAAIFESELARVDEWLSRQPNFATLSVRYTDCILNPVTAAEEVAGFVEVGQPLKFLDRVQMAAAVEPSLYRHRNR